MRIITHYQGKEITNEVIKKINLIAKTRYDEKTIQERNGGTNYNIQNINRRSDENIVLGEDWFISYLDKKNEIEILDWISLEKVSNKFIQTIEMLNEIKKILLLSKDRKINAYMRHLTSYQFYKKLLELEYIEEIYNYPQIDHSITPNSKEYIKEIVKKYGSLSNYLISNNNEYQILEQCIYHDTNFKITDKFIKKYQK